MTFDVYREGGQPGRPADLPATAALHTERGSDIADAPLVEAVNIAICVGQPLLVTGEPGCGKTRLAWSIAAELGLGEPLAFYTRSTSRAQDLLYTFDAVRRFHDIQARDARAADPGNYVTYEALGRAIAEGRPRVVLIDEVDKAPRDFPNDLLTELDRMWFEIRELDGPARVRRTDVRPIVVVTSNSERQLPLPFLRRCVFHHIEFPDAAKLRSIVKERLGTSTSTGTS
jgi:MoxR-like ATPase